MTPAPHALLSQLAAVPGVVGSLLFDARGAVQAQAFPPVFDTGGLQALAERLSGDGYFQEWMTGEQAALELRYLDGHVAVRTVDGSWLLVLCTPQANPQLLSMSLTQVIRRLRGFDPNKTGEFSVPVAAPAPGPVPAAAHSPVEQMRALVRAELGGRAAQALEILAAAGDKPKDLMRAASDVEKLTRLFIDKKKAEEIGRKLREILGR